MLALLMQTNHMVALFLCFCADEKSKAPEEETCRALDRTAVVLDADEACIRRRTAGRSMSSHASCWPHIFRNRKGFYQGSSDPPGTGTIKSGVKRSSASLSSCHSQVHRIQNPFLERMFKQKCEDVKETYKQQGAPTPTVTRLFHGTLSTAVESICENGFDWRRNGETTGTLYGKGSYFAKAASYSHNYATPCADGTRLMFMADVVVGLKCKGDPAMNYPPIWKEGISYDTTVDVVWNPSIFVKYDVHESYPAYLIQYAL